MPLHCCALNWFLAPLPILLHDTIVGGEDSPLSFIPQGREGRSTQPFPLTYAFLLNGPLSPRPNTLPYTRTAQITLILPISQIRFPISAFVVLVFLSLSSG